MVESKQKGEEIVATGDGGRRAAEGQTALRFRLLPQNTPLEETFADGALGVDVRSTVFKLNLYRVVGNDQQSGDELWSNSHRIVLPITAATQLIGILQRMVKGMEEAGVMRREPPPGDGGG